ncbi:LCP family protein required for cell wall assembly [Aeromicrobium sp. SORGH_AS981]|uniref:LCP family protein n=1 Tax=Aeromicrobium sp. SORGH_AS_0981 TaxID=3041802 RepID=UPI002858860E|nr:LCP family protein [Aeromicrobium sp. SORGH_AS_0981]MDR6120333.1 LCP family protein required for cell wall assembly [Aeromicrobium sp. SORGH_AS_0981]
MHDDRPTSSRTSTTRTASERIQLRRALTLTLMTLVVPGSAQVAAGNKRLGRVALRVWIACLVAGAVLLFLALFARTSLMGLMTDARLLTLLRFLLLAGAVFWAVLIVDAWRLGQPLRLARRHRPWVAGLNGALCLVTAGALVFAAHLVSVSTGVIDTVFAATTTSKPADGRYNVLLMGSDSGADRTGMRPDSLNVASIDAKTGRTVIIGLPRNLEDVPFPSDSFMKKEFPKTFDCEGCYLNAVNTWAEDHAQELGAKKVGERTPGIQATIDAVQEITGLRINYYALVNMAGFAKLVDAVGGVTVDVQERTPMFGHDDAWKQQYVEAGRRKLNGEQALWYARSRVLNNDFSRMGRQKCVMTAMLRELSPRKVLMNVEKIADSSKTLLDTDIPARDLNVFMELALKAKSQPVSSVSLVPPVIYTGNPDYDKVRTLISRAIATSEGHGGRPATDGILAASLTTLTPQAPAASSTATSAGTGTGAPAKDPTRANQTDDVDATC